MNDTEPSYSGPAHAGYFEARALALSVAAIRKAQGKRNPVDYAVGSPDWAEYDEAFARDVLRALNGE
jgi:hypothetical protein